MDTLHVILIISMVATGLFWWQFGDRSIAAPAIAVGWTMVLLSQPNAPADWVGKLIIAGGMIHASIWIVQWVNNQKHVASDAPPQPQIMFTPLVGHRRSQTPSPSPVVVPIDEFDEDDIEMIPVP